MNVFILMVCVTVSANSGIKWIFQHLDDIRSSKYSVNICSTELWF